jgi:hypothetical protein
MFSYICLYNPIRADVVVECIMPEGLNIVPGTVLGEILKEDPAFGTVQRRVDVSLAATGDKDTKRDQGFLLEESQCAFEKFFDAFLVFALVEAVNHNEIRGGQ